MEILQYSIRTGRYFEISDIIANIVGCLFGVLLSNLFKKLSS
ncbi:MAG: VanZ family protein [Saprospiraceae bacterium]